MTGVRYAFVIPGNPNGTRTPVLAVKDQGRLAMGGQLIDATVVQARPARLRAEEKAALRCGEEPEGWSRARRVQFDRNCHWTVKRGRKGLPFKDDGSKRQAVEIAVPLFGYKSYLSIDRTHGLIRTWTVTHAAAHDGGQLGALLDPNNTASGVWVDNAYRSAVNLELLAGRGRVGHLQRNKPRGNAKRCRLRATVEHVFAAQKQRFNFFIRTIGLDRAKAKIGLANLAYNLTRFAWLQGQAAPA